MLWLVYPETICLGARLAPESQVLSRKTLLRASDRDLQVGLRNLRTSHLEQTCKSLREFTSFLVFHKLLDVVVGSHVHRFRGGSAIKNRVSIRGPCSKTRS